MRTHLFRAVAALPIASLSIALSASALAGGPVCGDGLVGPNENCDDGNALSGDGCSDFCLIENNYECTGSFIPTVDNVVEDSGFEDGGGSWMTDTTTNSQVICNVSECSDGSFARDGAFWARLGSVNEAGESHLFRSVEIPTSHRYLEFDVSFALCSNDSVDELVVTMDEVVLLRLDATDARCGVNGYQTERIDLALAAGGPYNDGDVHELLFRSATFVSPDLPTVFAIDNVRIVAPSGSPTPGVCELEDRTLLYEDFDPGVAGDLGSLGFIPFELFDPVPWGTTDDGVCGSGPIPLGNVTGGAGEAACLDAAASGSTSIFSFLCAGPVNFENSVNSQLSFLLNLQLGQQTANDFFTVTIGIVPPSPATIFTYGVVFETFDNVGEQGFPPGELITVDISDLDGQPEGYVCLSLRSESAAYVQVDEFDIEEDDCIDDLDDDKLLSCFDNCTEHFNPMQTDSDGDGYGNACDGDINRETLPGRVPAGNGNDCIVNFADLGALRLAFFSTPMDTNWNPDADFNNDQAVNIEDLGIMRQFFFGPPGPSSATSTCAAPAP